MRPRIPAIVIILVSLSFFVWLMISLHFAYVDDTPYEQWTYVVLDMATLGFGLFLLYHFSEKLSPWKRLNTWVFLVFGTILVFSVVEIFAIQYPNFRRQTSEEFCCVAQYVFKVRDPHHPNQNMTLGVNLHARAFAALSGIRAEAYVYPDVLNRTGNTEPLKLYFDGSQCFYSNPEHLGIRQDCELDLALQPRGDFYFSAIKNERISYPRSGDFYVSISDSNGANRSMNFNPSEDFIRIDSVATMNYLVISRLTFNLTILSGLVALSAAIIATFLRTIKKDDNQDS